MKLTLIEIVVGLTIIAMIVLWAWPIGDGIIHCGKTHKREWQQRVIQ
jgi:type II secretory pathway component PulJ